MLREEYLRRLIDEAHIEIYLSAIDGARIYWPWRMHPPKDASRRYRDSCEQYIIDSDPLDDSVTTTDVLDYAYQLDAEVASLADVYQDKNATVETLLEGLEVYDSHPFDGELLLPLQEPFVDCWKEIGEPRTHRLGVGGLKDGTPFQRVEATKELRSAVGPVPWIHGFGWGVGDELAKSIRKNPNLLDSTDYSTPMQTAPMTGLSGTDEKMSVAASYAAHQLIRDLRSVSTYANEKSPEEQRPTGQAGMEQYGD